MVIKFDKTGELIQCEYIDFKRGGIKSHFSGSVYNVGIVGMTPTVDKDGKQLDSYYNWVAMLSRCYDQKFKKERPTYKDCKCCDEWLEYQNFVKWYDENYYEVDNEKMCLDKDILIKGNKIYSLDTCIFVPDNINVLFTKRDSKRGEYPIGVDYLNKNNNYRSRCNENGKSVYLGFYNTPEKAFYAYKKYKEDVIKSVAEKYKNKIPQKLYEAMYTYEVEITD